MHNHNLSEGAIEHIISGEQVDRPVFQVLGLKKIPGSGQGADRYRLLLSDGVWSHSSAMLATQLNEKVDSGELKQYAVVRLDKYLCNTIQPDRQVMILLEMEVLAPGSAVQRKLGNPQPYKAGAQRPQGATPANQPVAAANHNAGAGPSVASPVPSKAGSVYSRPQNTPTTPGGTPARIHPISSLTPYQNKWTIRARVTQKGQIRTWSNSRGEGKLFSMNMLDESGEIKATAFRDEVDRFYDMVEINKVYYITRGTLKTADKRYTSVDNDYEMTFNRDTQMTLCSEEVDLPSLTFNFVAINQLNQHDPNSTVDVIGVVKSCEDCSTVIGKASNKEITKRELRLVDESKVQVRLTLWGADAETFEGAKHPILAIKGCRVSDFGGRSLSVLASSQLVMNPDSDDAHRLRGWYDSVGHTLDYDEFRNEGGQASGGFSTNWKTFAEVKSENIGVEKADYFTTKGTIVFLKKDNCMYQACPSQDCNKKVIDQGNGMFRCEKCNKEFTNFQYRMILSANLVDHTDNQWATCFQETAETILDRQADEIGQMKDTESPQFDQIFQDATFKSFIFKLRAKMETYNDEQRLKTVCVTATPVDFVEYNKKLLEDIDKMLGVNA